MTGHADRLPERAGQLPGRSMRPAPRPGRRPGPSQTRDAVLGAARRLFAEYGYDKTTIRAIGREAGVDAALVHHYFGSKEQMFVAAMELPFEPSSVITDVIAGPRDELALRITRFFFSVWREPEHRAPLVALLRSATTNKQAAAMFREFIESAMLARAADALGLPRLHIGAAAAQLVGLVLVRYVIGVEPLASASEEQLVALVTPVLEYYLTGPGSSVEDQGHRAVVDEKYLHLGPEHTRLDVRAERAQRRDETADERLRNRPRRGAEP
jgi:AcrR family transcriptional regulator